LKICNGKTKYYNKEFNLKITMIKKRLRTYLKIYKQMKFFIVIAEDKLLGNLKEKIKSFKK